MPRFNLVHQFDRFPMRRDHVIPTPCDHQIGRQTQHPVGNGIAMMVIVEKPRVNIAFAQRRLNGGQVHGRTSIVNNGLDLSESAAETSWQSFNLDGDEPLPGWGFSLPIIYLV